MSDKIVIGIPNKGRLQEKTFDLFLKSGLEIVRNHGDREYYGTDGWCRQCRGRIFIAKRNLY